jgi:tetratricopeptide (TPR) repeat protein
MMQLVVRAAAVGSLALAATLVAWGQTVGPASEQLGKVDFPNSCSPAVQEKFLRSVALLHSFWYSEAERTFEEVAVEDRTCAIAAWGFASILMNNPLGGVGAAPKDALRAQTAIERGRQMGAKTQRERDYIEAVAAYYEDFANRPERARQLSRAKAFEALAAKYPDDDEAQIFYAVYLASTQVLSDQSYSAYRKAAGILEKQFAKHPDHPGVAHYLIHSYDAPPIAQQGLPAARRYALIAPDAPHALHMPSHIFTRVGAWTDSAATNRRSANVAKKGNEPDGALHAMDYMVYAYLQLARDTDAQRTFDEALQVTGTNPALPLAPYAIAAMPARIAVERGAWREAAQLQPTPSKYPFTEAMTHFARALGAARSSDAASAQKDVEQIAQLRDALKAAKNEYWATEVEVMRLAGSAWTSLARKNVDEALSLMRQAADVEDKNEKHIVTPARIMPARELLGDMLLELKRPAEALKEYEASQDREPNRLRGLYGAGMAASQLGDTAKAKQYFGRLLNMAGSASPRTEVSNARAYLASKLEAEQAAKQPHGDQPLVSLPKVFPRAASAWRSGEEAYYDGLLSKGHFDLLVVPFQVQDYAVDRSTRSLMTAELALAIGAAQKKVPDPYLVARALGDGERRLNADRINRLADKLRVSKIVWGYVGHLRNNTMRITIQYQDRTEDPRKPRGTLEARHFEKVPFSEEDLPAEVFQRMLPEVLKTIGLNLPTPAGSEVASRLEADRLPPSPLQMVTDRAEPARDAYYLQLLAAVAPRGAERMRERLIEKSMLAIFGMLPASADYRILKARALMQMGQRPAALKALGVPESDEEKHLFAMLNGNLPEVERYSARLKPGVRAIIARLELNEIASAYGARTQKKSLEDAKKLKLTGQTWPFLAARAFTDWDTWSQHKNGQLKVLLDREFPIAGFTAEGIVRGAVSLGDMSKVQTALDLSVLDHVRRFSETQAASWCCAPVIARLTAADYLDFLHSVGTDNLVRQAHLTAWTQGLPQEALEFLARIDSVYKDQPQLTVERARAEAQLAKQADGARKDGLLKSAYEHAFNAFFWEQGQTRNAAEAWEVLRGVWRQDFGFIGNLYLTDHPFRSFYPSAGGNFDPAIVNEKAGLRNSAFDFSPVTQLRWLVGELGHDWSAFEEILKLIEGRFAGNPQRVLLFAKESERKGDIRTAQRYYREDIRSQPGHWESYMDLGKLLFEEGDVGGAAKVFMSYPEFAKRSGENAVSLSNHAFNAGSLFYWSGNFRQAMPLYRIAAELQTGSNASMSSEIRIRLADGDYATALIGSLERARRYNTAFGYRDYLGMLHAMGHSQEAWDAFNVLIGQLPNPELWETPLVGHRLAGATESEIAEWVSRDPVRKSGYGGVYLLRAGVTDRTPTPELASAVAAVERPVWKVEYRGFVVRASVDGRSHQVLNVPDPGTLPLGVFDSAKKTSAKSDLVYFAEAYRAMRTRDFARANGLLDEAVALYDTRHPDLGYLLPYYAFAAAKSGNPGAVSARLEKFDIVHQRFDYHLARAVVAGLAGKTAESLRSLKLALYRRPFAESRPLYTEYQFAEICEWLYEATRNAKYRDMAVNWAKSVQAFSPWFAWPYAMEAKYTTNLRERSRAVAMAYYLDKKSERLAKIPKNEINAAVKGFSDRNLFLKTRDSSKESST